MSTKKSTNPIYSKDYYRMEKLIRDKRFKERVQWLRDEYAKMGYPIPQKGFEDHKEYFKWIKSFARFYYDNKKEELELSVLPIRKVKGIHTPEMWAKIQNRRNDLLPLMPDKFIKDTMQEFGLDIENEKFYSFILDHVFYGAEHLMETTLKISLTRNNKDAWDLFITVLPHTKLEHIKESWKVIKKYQKYLSGYIGKNKEREEFHRDLHIYEVYQAVKSELASGHIDEFGRHRVDEIAWSRLRKESKVYEKMTFEQIRQSNSRIAELDFVTSK